MTRDLLRNGIVKFYMKENDEAKKLLRNAIRLSEKIGFMEAIQEGKEFLKKNK